MNITKLLEVFWILRPKIIHPDQRREYIMTVNRAIAYRAIGQIEVCASLLEPLQRMPLSIEFGLAISAVLEDLDTLLGTMGKLREGDIPLEAFLDWPAFKDVRSNPDFLEKLEEIYGENAVVADAPR